MSKRDMLRQANNGAEARTGREPEKEAETYVDVVAKHRPRIGRPPEEPRRQVSVYLPDRQIRQLRIAAAEAEKERDQTSLVRSGLEIVLSLSAETYHRLKAAAQQQNTTIGELVEQALNEYLK